MCLNYRTTAFPVLQTKWYKHTIERYIKLYGFHNFLSLSHIIFLNIFFNIRVLMEPIPPIYFHFVFHTMLAHFLDLRLRRPNFIAANIYVLSTQSIVFKFSKNFIGTYLLDYIISVINIKPI